MVAGAEHGQVLHSHANLVAHWTVSANASAPCANQLPVQSWRTMEDLSASMLGDSVGVGTRAGAFGHAKACMRPAGIHLTLGQAFACVETSPPFVCRTGAGTCLRSGAGSWWPPLPALRIRCEPGRFGHRANERSAPQNMSIVLSAVPGRGSPVARSFQWSSHKVLTQALKHPQSHVVYPLALSGISRTAASRGRA